MSGLLLQSEKIKKLPLNQILDQFIKIKIKL